MEGDLLYVYSVFTRFSFQSTPSAWRETLNGRGFRITLICNFNPLPPHGGRQFHRLCKFTHCYFNPLPPHGGRPRECSVRFSVENISIHSLRMEGDPVCMMLFTAKKHFNPLPPHGGRPRIKSLYCSQSSFQSTPSAWRETSRTVPLTPTFFISIHSLRMEGDSKTAQESVFHFAYPCTILQKRMQKTTFCTRKNGFFRKKGEKFGAKPSASFCAPMIRTDTFPLNFSHRISGSSMSMVSFAPICSTFD